MFYLRRILLCWCSFVFVYLSWGAVAWLPNNRALTREGYSPHSARFWRIYISMCRAARNAIFHRSLTLASHILFGRALKNLKRISKVPWTSVKTSSDVFIYQVKKNFNELCVVAPIRLILYYYFFFDYTYLFLISWRRYNHAQNYSKSNRIRILFSSCHPSPVE